MIFCDIINITKRNSIIIYVKLKKPSELFEQKRLEALAKESVQDQKQLNKRIVSPKELFGEIVENVFEESLEEKIEEPIDPYIQEVNSLKLQLEDLSNSIPEETDLTEVFENIKSLKKRIDDLPKQKSYDQEIESIRKELVRIEDNIPIVEKFDPSDLYGNIVFIKTRLEEVHSAIPVVPEPILYDDELNELKGLIENVRKNMPIIPEIKYYDEELQGILNLIEDVKNQIPELPVIKYYDDEISVIENRLIEIQNSIPVVPEVKYYDEDVKELQEEIALVKASIPVVPEVKYYDEDVKELQEEIALVKASIPVVPKIKYYDEDVKELQEEIALVKASIPVVPKIKYYDEEVKDLYKKVSAIKIPDQGKYLKEVKEIYETFEKKNHKLLEKVKYLEEVFEKFNEETLTEGLLNEPPDVKNSDPLTPLDQNFVTLSQLQDHYRLFINRIQQQLSTIGGGGETRLEFLDDIDRTSAKINGRFLKYDATSKKWIGALGGGGGSQTLDDTLQLGNDSSIGMSVGIVTASKFVGDGSLLTNLPNAEYSNIAGIATYSGISGIATYATTAGYSTSSGIATYATSSGIATYSGISGIATYASTAGIATYATSSGIATYATSAGIATYATSSGIATYATSAGIATIAGYASTSGISTVAQNLTGSPNITVSSVNSSGVVTASSFSGSGANLTLLNASNLSSGTVPSTRITASSGDFTVGQNLYVNGSLSVGGTSVILNAQQLVVSDKDIVVGYTTDANNNDISNDNTANHGGISVASTVGNPIINIPLQVGINSNPSTYKQIMWIKQGNYSGMGTDAWVFNYGVSIGNTSTVQYGSRLTVGTGFTVYDTYLDATDIRVRNINAVGIITATTFNGNASSATYATSAGIATYAPNAGIATYATSSGIATYATTAGIATYATSSGIATYAPTAGISTYASAAGISTYATSSGIATYATSSGIATYATSSGISTVSQGLTGTPNINVGVVTATKYYGDGSSLTGIVASGSGVVIKNNGSVVGTATTIDFTTNLSVTFGSGIATVSVINSSNSGYANTAGIATYATSAGIATYATSSGIATYATSAGIATYATSSGIATYASTAGISTVAQGLTGTPNITVGVVTATSVNATYFGSGTNLTGIVTSIVAGTNITVSGSTGQVTINSSGGGTPTYGGGQPVDLLEVMLFS